LSVTLRIVHTTITKADRDALENLWGEAGTWAAASWTRHNSEHFDGRLRYHGIVWGLTPHGGRLGHTYASGRITLHPSLLAPQESAWGIRDQLGARYAEDVLLHEMVHSSLFERDISNSSRHPHHNTEEWCAEIMRITPQLGLEPVKAAPVKPRRIKGVVKREPLDGHLSRDDISHWPHSLRPAGYYTSEGRIHVPI
jgi:hypothetical protein